MVIDGEHVDTISVRVDANTVLHIANTCVRTDPVQFAVQAEFGGEECTLQYFKKASEVWRYYHIHNEDICDRITRVMDFVMGEFLHSEDKIEIINDADVHSFDVRLDEHMVIHIAKARTKTGENRLAVQAEFDGKKCSLQYFKSVGRIFPKYHIHNSDTRDAINRIVHFIFWKL